MKYERYLKLSNLDFYNLQNNLHSPPTCPLPPLKEINTYSFFLYKYTSLKNTFHVCCLKNYYTTIGESILLPRVTSERIHFNMIALDSLY